MDKEEKEIKELNEFLLEQLARGNFLQAGMSFKDVLDSIIENEKIVYEHKLSNENLSEITKISYESIKRWKTKNINKVTDPMWGNAMLCLRKLGYSVILIKNEDTSISSKLKKK